MKYLILLLSLCANLAFAQVLDRLSQTGCDFVAAVAACTTDEVLGKVPEGFCEKSSQSVLDEQLRMLPTADFSKIEALVEQEIKRVKVSKLKDPQKVFNEFQDKCYAASGVIKTLMNDRM
jgi:hypothetical protein